MLARGGILGLLAQNTFSKVPTDGYDLIGPGDAGSVPERPTASHVAARRGTDVNDSPLEFRPGFAVDAKAGRGAPLSQPIGPKLIEHACGPAAGRGAANAAPAMERPDRGGFACRSTWWAPKPDGGTATGPASCPLPPLPSAIPVRFPAPPATHGN